ncbi:alkaline phosphatase family protein [bacterium]|nr:MAG: alkaline phosphatase family protein [bacterium]
MKPNFLLFSFFALTLACSPSTKNETKIAFGSCAWNDGELPVFNLIVEHKPDYFIFLGDNIYGDTKDPDVLKMKYQKLADKASYQNLKKNVPIMATWDDHDFGWNDSGKEYELKEVSKEIFLDFFDEPTQSERRNHTGIYTSYEKQIGDKTLQIILLDVRTFRDRLKPYQAYKKDDSRYFYHLDYEPQTSADSTLLGKEQWIWLEQQLQQPADIRLIGSGTQFGVEFNGYEAWANFPHEQKRIVDLINKTKANGVVFLTGDVHYAELSKYNDAPYPLYDFTASGLSATWHFATPNVNRIEGPIMDNHFGLITISWEKDPKIRFETFDINDNQRIEYSIRLSDISFKTPH